MSLLAPKGQTLTNAREVQKVSFGCLGGGARSDAARQQRENPKQCLSGPHKGFTAEEFQSLSDDICRQVKAAVISELGLEIRDLSTMARDHSVNLGVHIDMIGAMNEEIRSLKRKVRILQAQYDEMVSGGGRCGLLPRWQWRARAAVKEGPSVKSVRQPAAGTKSADGVASGVDEAVPTRPPSERGPLGCAMQLLQRAVVLETHGEVYEVQRTLFVEGLDALADALDKVGGNMGSYLKVNTTKLRKSKAASSEESYHEWLLTELPTHAVTNFKEYADDSAWMANLWIGWTLEFFVVWFALLHGGKDMKTSFDMAYKQTLQQHHTFFQRTAFTSAAKRLPSREKFFQVLGDESDVARDVANFVAIGGPVVRFCSRINDEVSSLLQEERRVFLQK